MPSIIDRGDGRVVVVPGQPDTHTQELQPWMEKTVPEREDKHPAPESGSGIILALAIIISGVVAVIGKWL